LSMVSWGRPAPMRTMTAGAARARAKPWTKTCLRSDKTAW
jgi:hypothetical protein